MFSAFVNNNPTDKDLKVTSVTMEDVFWETPAQHTDTAHQPTNHSNDLVNQVIILCILAKLIISVCAR